MVYNKSKLLLFLLVTLTLLVTKRGMAQQIWEPDHSIGTANGVYSFAYNQTPSQLVEIYPAAIPNTGLTYQWYSSATPTAGFTAIAGAASSSYSPPSLTSTSVTTYYKRATTSSSLGTIYSNIVQINCL